MSDGANDAASALSKGCVSTRRRTGVLLGGEAGLRCGEIMALEWTDVDLWWGARSLEAAGVELRLAATINI